MIKGTPELIAQRREEIVNACEGLYQTMSFKDITLKEIGQVTSFSRPTIYNYFQTKEEIFLALFEREYRRWNQTLEEILASHDAMTRQQLAEAVAHSLEEREQLLKLLSMNNYDMEANSRAELLVSFKTAYGDSMKNLARLLEKFCPELTAQDVQGFLYQFFPFMFGIYPYTTVTEKQKTAMEQAGIHFRYQSVYELTYAFLIRLLEI
jgi:AcrR family transcriptional regulator